MALLIKGGTYTKVFFMTLTSDHISPATGKSPTVTISKAGAAFGSPNAGSIAEISSGWYSCTYNATDLNTAGELAFHATAASSDATDDKDQVLDTTVAQIGVNNVQWLGGTIPAVNTTGVPLVDAKLWLGGAIPAVNVTGVPLVDTKYLLGTIFSTPATAGIMDINLKNIVNAAVSTSTAQLGVNVVSETQPVGFKKNTARAKFTFYAVLSSDHITPATGKTIATQVSKDGGAFANMATATATEIANGFYYIDVAAADVNCNTGGFFFSVAGIDPVAISFVTSA